MIRRARLPFVFLAFISLILGLWTGLNRLGWNLSLSSTSLDHGAIMVGGFLGTLISLEKIIPLKKNLLFALPLLSAAAVALFVANLPNYAFIFLVAASTGLAVVFIYYLLKEKNLIYVLMSAGALSWLTGNLLLITERFYPLAFPWWLAFALLIITAERLELMKFLPVAAGTKSILLALLTAYLVGAVLSFHGPGNLVCGLALIAISLWLMRYDIIGISIRKDGLTKYVAIALLAGYGALLFTGVFFISLGGQVMAYDVIVHTFFLGFVFSMIFAHGPIILPGVLGVSVKPFHPLFYGWLLLLHFSWILRTGSDIILDFQTRKLSGMITSISILGYFGTLAAVTFISLRRNAKLL